MKLKLTESEQAYFNIILGYSPAMAELSLFWQESHLFRAQRRLEDQKRETYADARAEAYARETEEDPAEDFYFLPEKTWNKYQQEEINETREEIKLIKREILIRQAAIEEQQKQGKIFIMKPCEHTCSSDDPNEIFDFWHFAEYATPALKKAYLQLEKKLHYNNDAKSWQSLSRKLNIIEELLNQRYFA